MTVIVACPSGRRIEGLSVALIYPSLFHWYRLDKDLSPVPLVENCIQIVSHATHSLAVNHFIPTLAN